MPPEPVLHLSLPVDDLDVARRFYVDVFDCRVGRVRDDWLDVWFFGLQLTLQARPDEVRPASEQGVRHFGVVVSDRDEFDRIVERVGASGWDWITEPEQHESAELSGKLGGKLADPGGNVIEVKFYADPTDVLGLASSPRPPAPIH